MVRRIMTTSLFFIFEGQSFRQLKRTWLQPLLHGGFALVALRGLTRRVSTASDAAASFRPRGGH